MCCNWTDNRLIHSVYNHIPTPKMSAMILQNNLPGIFCVWDLNEREPFSNTVQGFPRLRYMYMLFSINSRHTTQLRVHSSQVHSASPLSLSHIHTSGPWEKSLKWKGFGSILSVWEDACQKYSCYTPPAWQKTDIFHIKRLDLASSCRFFPIILEVRWKCSSQKRFLDH